MPVEVPHVLTMALAGGGLLIEPVPVAATHPPIFSFHIFTEIIWQIAPRWSRESQAWERDLLKQARGIRFCELLPLLVLRAKAIRNCKKYFN